MLLWTVILLNVMYTQSMGMHCPSAVVMLHQAADTFTRLDAVGIRYWQEESGYDRLCAWLPVSWLVAPLSKLCQRHVPWR